MDRKECEARILDYLEGIKQVYQEYNPNGQYLSLCLHDNGAISFHNDSWEEANKDYPIDYWQPGDEEDEDNE